MSVDAYLNSLSLEGKSQHTLRAYQRELDLLPSVINDLGVQSHYQQRIASLSQSSKAMVYSTINGYMNWLVAHDKLAKNPLRTVRYPKMPQSCPRPVRSSSVSPIEQRLADLPLKYRLAFRLIRSLALRASELLSLDVESFDLDTDFPTVRVLGKGEKTRVLPLNPDADYFLDLREYLAQLGRAEGELFRSDRGVRESYSNLRLKWRTVTEEYTIHQLRHTKATGMINAGASLRDVQVFLGHSSPVTTTRYTLGGEDTQRRIRSFV